MEEEKNNVENSAEPIGDQVADLQSSGDQAPDAQSSAVVPLQPDKPLSGKELRRQKKEAAAAQKAEAAAQKAREKAEAEAQKARQKEESLAAKLQRRQEKKEYRQGVRQERGQEIRLLWHIVEVIMLVTFIVLAIDQDKRYSGDNRLIAPKSSYRRSGLAPRCRLVTSWGWRRSQGLGCSPIKAVRELGSERRETVRSLSIAGVRYLKRAVLSTRGPGWTYQWCISCLTRGTAE